MSSFTEWWREFWYITVKNGKVHYKPSSTKFLRNIFMILTVVIILLIITAFAMKLFVTSGTVQERLTTDTLQVFVALGGIVSILTGYLQNVYSKNKGAEVEKLLEESP